MDLNAQLDAFERAALEEIAAASDPQVLEAVRVRYLGARQGKLNDTACAAAGSATFARLPGMTRDFWGSFESIVHDD